MPLRALVSASLASIVLSACQQSSSSHVTGSPTPSPSASAPLATPSGPPARTKALVLVSSAATVPPDLLLYDPSTNTTETLLRSQLLDEPRFVSSDRISYILNNQLIVRDLGSQHSEVVSDVGGLTTYAWAPGGSPVYLSDGMDGDLLVAGSGSAGKTLARWALGGEPPQAGAQFDIQFSHDGHYFVVVDTLAAGPAQSPEARRLQVRRANGELAFAPPDTSKTFPSASEPLWSAKDDVLYFQASDGIHAWDANSGTESLKLPGLRWYHPTASQDGQYLAYSTLDAAKVPSVEVYDLQRHTVVFSRKLRWGPLFVTADTLWYLEQSPCTQSCGAVNAKSTGKILAYQLSTGNAIELPFGKMWMSAGGASDLSGDYPAAVWNG